MADTGQRDAPSLLVFADDWGRHPSSCQHLVRRLLSRYPVTWVNTIGTRRPQLSWLTLRRGLEKALDWTVRPGGQPARPVNPTVLKPRMWPTFSPRFGRGLNRRLLLRQLGPVLRRSTGPVIGVTTLPITADLMGPLPVDRWVYYCVDDFSQWPGLDGEVLRELEADTIHRADALIAVSGTLQARLAEAGRPVHLLSHGIDVRHWASRDQAVPPAFRECERPLVLFWGLIDRRLDLAFLASLSASLDRGTVVLMGPTNDPDPRLGQMPRVRLLPAVPYDDLPAAAHAADVLVMPYADLPVTRAMQPLKLNEYLATGKPAVVRDLPATRPWADGLDLAATPDGFAALVHERLAGGLPPAQARARERLKLESWEAKAAVFEAWLTAGVGGAPAAPWPTPLAEHSNRPLGGPAPGPCPITAIPSGQT